MIEGLDTRNKTSDEIKRIIAPFVSELDKNVLIYLCNLDYVFNNIVVALDNNLNPFSARLVLSYSTFRYLRSLSKEEINGVVAPYAWFNYENKDNPLEICFNAYKNWKEDNEEKKQIKHNFLREAYDFFDSKFSDYYDPLDPYLYMDYVVWIQCLNSLEKKVF